MIARDLKMFKLNLLLSLTEPLGDEECLRDMASLHFKYKMILQRRIKCKAEWIGAQQEDPDLLVEKIFFCRHNLKQLALLNQKIMSSQT